MQLFSRNDSAAQKWGFEAVPETETAAASTTPTTTTTAPTTAADMANIKTQLAEISGKLALIAKGL